MTSHDALANEIVRVLRHDVGQAASPRAARERVALRLATSAGVLGLGASVTVSTQAAAGVATLATLGTSATVAAPSTSTLAGVTLLGLLKALGVGMGLGAGVGLGLHVAFRGVPHAAEGHDLASYAVLPVASGGPRSPKRAVTWAAPTPTTPGSDADSSEEIVRRPPAREAAPRPAPATPRLNPGAELPGDSPLPPEASRGLAEQQALLDEARLALRQGDGALALAAVRRHSERFPHTAFEEERQAVAIKALALLGKRAEARARALHFAQVFPQSLLLPSLEAVVGPEAKSVMEAPPSPQTSGGNR